jgi:molybdopterin-guanine dinucleotide biosynthesis protein A
MGGAAKGLLLARDRPEPLVVRLARIAGETIPDCEIVLVGRNAAYAELAWPVLDDAPGRTGPIAGLISLLRAAEERNCRALALACDFASVTRELLERLVTHAPQAAAVAPRMAGIWEPLFARYAPERCLPAARDARAPWRVLEAVGAAELPLSDAEHGLLHDWDTPDDVQRS